MSGLKKKILSLGILLSLTVFLSNCSMGLGIAVYNCSVCNTLYYTLKEAESCTVTRYCPGASKEEIKDKESTIEKKDTVIKENQVEIKQQKTVIKEQKDEIKEQQQVIEELSDALGSKLNFTSKGFNNKPKDIYPEIWLDKCAQNLTYQEQNDNNIQYLPRLKGDGFGYRSYNYWTFYYTLKVSEKNLVYRVIYDQKYNDWSVTSAEEVRVKYGEDRVFDVYTSVVCLDEENKIWVMKLVDMIDIDNSYYTLVKETGDNEFMKYGKYETLTQALDADYKNGNWVEIDYSSFATAEGMDIGADTNN